MKANHEEILKEIEKFLEKNPHQRFGQALFNLRITKFMNPDYPVKGEGGLVDIYNDRDEEILNRIKSAISKMDKEQQLQ
jgi:hypothetical protein